MVGRARWPRSSRFKTIRAVASSFGVGWSTGAWAPTKTATAAAMPIRARAPFGRRKAKWGMGLASISGKGIGYRAGRDDHRIMIARGDRPHKAGRGGGRVGVSI